MQLISPVFAADDENIEKQLQQIQRLQQLAQNESPQAQANVPQMPGSENLTAQAQTQPNIPAPVTAVPPALQQFGPPQFQTQQPNTQIQNQIQNNPNQQQAISQPPQNNAPLVQQLNQMQQHQMQQQMSQSQPNQPTQQTQNQAPPQQFMTPQQMQQMSAANQQMMAEPQDQQQAVREAAFENVSQDLMPLSPEQIQRLHQSFNSIQFASEGGVGTPPRPVASSKFVSLAPGTTPPVIRLSQGFVSSLVFVDSTGAPWPIQAYDLGNPSAFNIQWDKKSNTLMIQATKLYTYGNLAVQLQGLPTPVMITLVPGQKAIDYRVDLRIQGFGPNAKHLPTGSGLPSSASPVLLGVLDGVPPPGSSPLQVVGGNAQAWVNGETLYLRTRLTLLSPSWIATMTSADGTKAYELISTSTLLVSDNGKLVQLMLKRSFEE